MPWRRQELRGPRSVVASCCRPILLGAAENGRQFRPFTRPAQQLPAAPPHVLPPSQQLLPLPRRRAEHAQVGHRLPVRRIGFRGHGSGSGGAISRVLFARLEGAQMVISLGWPSPATSSGLPAARATRAGSRCLFGLAPTGGCRAASVAERAVGSYPTVSPLPFGYKGGLFSVALSVALRRPGVTWQSARWSSDFPRRAILPSRRDHRAPPNPAPGS